MRLWHKDLIPVLPKQQLLGQWRECCAIAKNIAEKGIPNHVLVNRIMEYTDEHFNSYALRIYREMEDRGYNANFVNFSKYRDSKDYFMSEFDLFNNWHNDIYLRQCLYNLEEKYLCGAIPTNEWYIIYEKYKNKYDLVN